MIKIEAERVRLDLSRARQAVTLMACRLPDVVVTSCYLAVVNDPPRMLVDQTYENIKTSFTQMRPKLTETHFELLTDPLVRHGPHVVIGGPIDDNWYHWLANWCPRFTLLEQLRPDLFDDPDVTFVVDTRASVEPFRSLIAACGVDMSRVMFWTREQDLWLRDAVLVTFPNQNYLYPEVLRAFVSRVNRHFLELDHVESVAGPPRRRRRIFASRQGFSEPRRRIANFDAVEAVLREYGFEIVLLGQESAQDQVRMFADAEFVLGVHGSDLANLMFCAPGTAVLVIENQRNILIGHSVSLEVLCGIVGARYSTLIVDEVLEEGRDYAHFPTLHHRDVIVPPDRLREALHAIGCFASIRADATAG